MGHPGTLYVEFNLNADDGTDKEGDKQNDADGVHAQLCHFAQVLSEKHAHTVWS